MTLTFEQSVRAASDVFIGTLSAINDPEPFDAGGIRYREIDISVTEPLKGDFEAGQLITALEAAWWGPDARLPADGVGKTFLFVGGRVRGVASVDGTRTYDEAFAFASSLTYLRTQVAGMVGAAALRVYSPFAQRIGHYPGNIEALQQRARDQKPLRPVELLPWSELLARVEKPAVDVEKHLGSEELDLDGEPSAPDLGDVETDEETRRENEEMGPPGGTPGPNEWEGPAGRPEN